MEQEKEVQSSYHLTEINPPETGQGPVDYVNIIQEGFLLPHFSLLDSSGNRFVLKDLIGKKNIVFVFLHRFDCFCTAFFLEELQANLAEMKSYNATVAAVSVEHPRLISDFASRLKL
ncbi:MAG: redoxin domain-containing protein, partial [candidate division Zixibacteria bacterium]|nr:redoxin domain-containing protein [candidate division Zixibacteria bacterium]